jgi:ABC-type Zn uptake system ZnuABC Zn-binding protein ZnuA
VVTTVSPITDLARNVSGGLADVTGVVPEGVDSHTFEPSTETARLITDADLVLVNGLGLEEPIIDLARAVAPDSAPVYALGDHAVGESEHVYDLSFPESGGRPNPHLWMSVPLAIEYCELTAEQMASVDKANAAEYRANARRYIDELARLDDAIRTAVATIPPPDRVLLTYHDSFAYFAREYGFRVIGAIQPADFVEPSAREVARLIDQIRAEDVPAIFGSEVFPSPVLEQIARDANVRYESSLRDDDLPGEPGHRRHSYVGLIVYDVAAIVDALGGDSTALHAIDPQGGRS